MGDELNIEALIQSVQTNHTLERALENALYNLVSSAKAGSIHTAELYLRSAEMIAGEMCIKLPTAYIKRRVLEPMYRKRATELIEAAYYDFNNDSLRAAKLKMNLAKKYAWKIGFFERAKLEIKTLPINYATSLIDL